MVQNLIPPIIDKSLAYPQSLNFFESKQGCKDQESIQLVGEPEIQKLEISGLKVAEF